MSTLGVGVDVVDVESFALQLADTASGFVAATFTAAERRDAGGEPRRLGARFAAKEALVKAWSGARLDSPPAASAVDLREIEVARDAYDRPLLRLHGAVAAGVAVLAEGGEVRVHVSLSHDGPTAVAMVVLEAASG